MSEVKHTPEASASEVMVLLATLNDVRLCLEFLCAHGIVQKESIAKGCKKFISDHPQINAHLSRVAGATS